MRLLDMSLIALIAVGASSVSAQTAGPAEALADYVGGLRNGDTEQLLRVLHPAGQVCFQPGPTRPTAACEPFSSAAPRWTKTADPAARGKVLHQHDATANMTTITYELFVRDTHFIDQFLMYRVDGRWWVMAKSTEIVTP
jgi:hypothetical protein